MIHDPHCRKYKQFVDSHVGMYLGFTADASGKHLRETDHRGAFVVQVLK